MTNGVDAGSLTNAVRIIEVLGKNLTYEQIGKLVAQVIGVIVAGLFFQKWFRTFVVPEFQTIRKLRSAWQTVKDAFQGAAWLKAGRPMVEDMLARLNRIECSVATSEAIKRAEWQATAESRIKFDADCRLTFANATSLAIMGLDSQRASGFGWRNAVTELARESVWKQMQEAAHFKSDAEIAFPIDTPGAAKDAQHFVLHLNAIPNGTPTGFGGFAGWFSYRDGRECGLGPICPLGLDKRIARLAVA